jgi:AcrR family transcriptional regulator
LSLAVNRQRRTQAERRAETRAAVLESACRLFGSKGYADTSLDEIAAGSGVTIRPIYHYFGNKVQLFAAVNEVMEERIVASLQANAATGPKEPILSAWRAFLELCEDSEFRRIVLIDSPNILGRERWSESPVTRTAAALLSRYRGNLNRRSAEIAGRMLMGALSEAALSIAESDDPASAGRAAETIVNRVAAFLLPHAEHRSP